MFSKIKLISLAVLGPLLFYPLIFCPFRLPYLYCSICYLKCPWARLRGFLLLGILGLNLKKRFYCSFLCPCGTIQDLQSKVNPVRWLLSNGVKVKKFILPSWSYYFRYFILGLVVLFILATKRYSPFIITSHILWFLIALVFLLSFFSHRFWCLILCPIGALSDIVLRIRRIFK